MVGERFSQHFPWNRGGSKEPSPQQGPSFWAKERSRYQLHIREFQLPPEVEGELSERDLEVLRNLKEAAKQIAAIYSFQESEETEKANFYPFGVNKLQVLKAGRTNPDILSPYTIVVRDENGNLSSLPVHEVFKAELRPVSRLLRDAANRTRDWPFKFYLSARATSFENGNFKASERYWLERNTEPEIDIVIGFYDTYTDKFLGTKYSAEAWVGVLDRKTTDDSEWFKNSFLQWWQEETGQDAPRIKMRIDHTVIQTGQAAKYEWVGNSLPCQQEWRRELGSKFTIFKPVFEDDFTYRLEPSFRTTIHPDKRRGISDEMLKVATLRKIIAHEIGHSLDIPEDVQTRLHEHASWIKELYCDLIALKGYSKIEGLNPREREPETALAMTLASGRLDYQIYNNSGKDHTRQEYFRARAIILKYLLDGGNLRIETNRSGEGFLNWDNPHAVFDDIQDLLIVVENIMRQGQLKDAEAFLNHYFNPRIYDQIERAEFEGNGTSKDSLGDTSRESIITH